eukprot:m51a1_g4707 hypothetical protein (882) ;mRNA; f:257318-274013
MSKLGPLLRLWPDAGSLLQQQEAEAALAAREAMRLAQAEAPTPRTPDASPRTPTAASKRERSRSGSAAPSTRGRQLVVKDLLRDISLERLNSLRKEFERAGGGVNRAQFVRALMAVCREAKEDSPSGSRGLGISGASDDVEAIFRLADLFSEIDINGDGSLTFDEFSEFVVHNGVDVSDDGGKGPPEYVRVPIGGLPVPTSSSPDITGLQFIPDIDCVVASVGSLVRLYRPVVGIDQPELQLVREWGVQRGTIITTAFDPLSGHIVTSVAGEQLAAWDPDQGYRCRWEMNLNSYALAVHFQNNFRFMITANVDGNLYAYDASQPPDEMRSNYKAGAGDAEEQEASWSQLHHAMQRHEARKEVANLSFPEVWKTPAHAGMATCIAALSDSQICTGGSDGVIKLWDIHTGAVANQFVGHSKGVFKLAYHTGQHLMISAGADRDGLVWSPLSKSASPLGRLRGHRRSLVGVEALGDTPYVFTADQSGVFRLWDLRTYECVQRFSIDEEVDGASGKPTAAQQQQQQQAQTAGRAGSARMRVPAEALRRQRVAATCLLPTHGLLLGAGDRERIECFQCDSPANAWLTDEFALLSAAYSSHSGSVLTISARDIRVWEAETGQLVRSLRCAAQGADISAAAVDASGRRVAVGDSDGGVRILNASDGTPLRKMAGHRSLVSVLLWTAGGALVSASLEGTISVHSVLGSNTEDAPDASVRPEGGDILLATKSDDLNVVATAHSDGGVRMWTVLDGGGEGRRTSIAGDGQSLRAHRSDVTAIAFLDPYALAVSCDSTGGVCLWTARPAGCQFKVLYQWPNLHTGSSACAVTDLAFLSAECVLVTGDEHGEWVEVDPELLVVKVAVVLAQKGVEAHSVLEVVRQRLAAFELV